MYYSEDLVEEVRIHNDIVDIVSDYVTLKKKGNSYFGLCPFHNEKTPSFAVSPDKQMYYCFGCGAGGNVYTFVMEYENYNFVEAIKFLAERVNITLPSPEVTEETKRQLNEQQQLRDINRETARYFYFQLKSVKGKKALEYLNKRDINQKTIIKFGLGYSNYYRDDLYRYLIQKGFKEELLLEAGVILKDKKEGYYDRFWNRLMFPIFDVHNRVIGFGGRVLGEGMPKYLNSPETKLFDKSKNLYGLNIARTARKGYILMVEGYMDVISLHQAGFTEAVASLGTALTNGQARLLKRYTDEVLISYDSDDAGLKAAQRAIPILKKVGLSVKIVKVIPYKDPDEFIKNMGADEFEKRIQSAQNSFFFELEIIEKGYNLTDPDEKTKFIDKIAEKILEFKSEIERDNYIEAVSKQYEINKEHLINLVNHLGSRVGLIEESNTRKIIKYEKKEDGIDQVQKIMLCYLVNKPNIYKKVKDYIKPNDFKEPVYNKLANLIYNDYENNQDIKPARIINQFATIEEQKQASYIFNMSISHENIYETEKLINELVNKMKRFSLDYASRNAKDVEELQRIIVEQSQLQKLHISLYDG
ncbi:MAG: DNA primase [Eubacteriales bacterium]